MACWMDDMSDRILVVRTQLPTATRHPLRVVYPPGTGSESLALIACGVREWMTPGIYERPRGTDDLLIAAFHQPSSLGVEGELVAAPPGSLILWRPHSPNRYGREDGPWCHSWLHLD